MKQQSANLRHAFSSHPSRFLASGAGYASDTAQSSASLRLFEPALTARRPGNIPVPLVDKLRELGLGGMARCVERLDLDSCSTEISFEQKLSLLIEHEFADRNKRQLARRLRQANLRYNASIAEVDYNAVRGFDDALFHLLAMGKWIAERENAIIEGPTGVGKTWLACALAEKACRDGKSVRYERMPHLMADLVLLHGSRRYSQRMRRLQAVDLLILDDWGLERFQADQRVEIFEILDRRYDERSTLIVSQCALENWPRIIGRSTGAVLVDRIIHNAHRLRLKGGSLRHRPQS